MAKTPTKSSPAPINPVGEITIGVDTHLEFHVAAAKDALGRTLGTIKFPATRAGFAQLLTFTQDLGPLALAGVEGTGCYGTTLTTFLSGHQVRVVEVNRPNRQKRRRNGKSDTLDAISAAAAVLSGEATATPKTRTGPIESVRLLRIARDQHVTSRTAAINALKAMLVTAPTELRESLHGLSTTALIRHCATLPAGALPAPRRGDKTRRRAATALATALRDATTAVHATLAELARMIEFHTQRERDLDTTLDALLHQIAPRTMALHGLGAQTAGQLLVTAGDHPDRLHSEAAFAVLTGVAPQDCSSGKHENHRLSRAGDRHANAALYRIIITRLAHHQPTRDYMHNRLGAAKNLTKKHLIRCLKRYLAREIYPRLKADLAALHTA